MSRKTLFTFEVRAFPKCPKMAIFSFTKIFVKLFLPCNKSKTTFRVHKTEGISCLPLLTKVKQKNWIATSFYRNESHRSPQLIAAETGSRENQIGNLSNTFTQSRSLDTGNLVPRIYPREGLGTRLTTASSLNDSVLVLKQNLVMIQHNS